MRSKAIVILALTVIVLIAGAFLVLNRPQLVTIDADIPAGFPESAFSHETFEELLRAFVDDKGYIDYQAWHEHGQSRRLLDEYLAAVGRFSPESDPQRFPRKSDALAYWMYAYNAYVIKSVLDRWPLGSVTDIQAPVEVVKGFGFFYRLRFPFGGRPYSLYAIENDIIRKGYRDVRIHFVLNCGSDSCPPMLPVLPTGDELEPFLQQAAENFVSESKNVRINHEKREIVLSEIFKWNEKDFINDLRLRGLPTSTGLFGYIGSIAPQSMQAELAQAEDYELVFVDYDWSVNQTRSD
jgi:hypothetical protein